MAAGFLIRAERHTMHAGKKRNFGKHEGGLGRSRRALDVSGVKI